MLIAARKNVYQSPKKRYALAIGYKINRQISHGLVKVFSSVSNCEGYLSIFIAME